MIPKRGIGRMPMHSACVQLKMVGRLDVDSTSFRSTSKRCPILSPYITGVDCYHGSCRLLLKENCTGRDYPPINLFSPSINMALEQDNVQRRLILRECSAFLEVQIWSSGLKKWIGCVRIPKFASKSISHFLLDRNSSDPERAWLPDAEE